LPDVPSIGETVKGFEFTNWWGMLAPTGTPAEALSRLNQEFTAIAAMTDVQERLLGLGLAARSSTPAEFGAFLRSETDKIHSVVKSAGITVN
jgi:tripartite-type tricarboxylate transporter receptor subunit TctC